MNNCQSCGMPMEKPEDFGGGNISNLYCKYCSDAQGDLLPKETVRENITQFNIKAYGKTREQAEVDADNLMNQMVAWNSGVSGVVEESQAVQPEEIPAPAPVSVEPSQDIYSAPAASPVDQGGWNPPVREETVSVAPPQDNGSGDDSVGA